MFCNFPGSVPGFLKSFRKSTGSIVHRHFSENLVVKLGSHGAADAKLRAHLVEQFFVYGGSRLMPFLHHVKERSRNFHIASLRCEALSLPKGTAEHIIPRLHLMHADLMAGLHERRRKPWRDRSVITYAIFQAVREVGLVTALIALAALL